MRAPRAWWAGRGRNLTLAIIALSLLTAWAIYHFVIALRAMADGGHPMATLWLVALLLLWWIPLAWMERPARVTRRQQAGLDQLVVVVQVPVYNEDEDALRNCLESVLTQSRRVDRIRVVDDGSVDAARGLAITYQATKEWFLDEAGDRGIEATWDRTPNRGKRHAQMQVLATDPGDIFVTLDSDSILDREAIAEGLKPFANPKVTSVAGCVVVLNSQANALTRLICMLYTPFTRGFRSAQSVLGRVMVNSGTLAFYRAEVVRKHAASYPYERFAGRPMQMNDDSMLTMYAMLEGDTVHQPSSIVFTLVPETWKHYRNQSMRWMRGTFVRTLWWLRYMPMHSAGFWMPLIELTQLLLAIVIAVVLGRSLATTAHPSAIIVPAILVTLGMNYLIALRFFMIKRDDESFAFHLSIYALAPVAALWRLCVLRPMQLYAMATCWKVNKWGTREVVEVGMSGSEGAPALPTPLSAPRTAQLPDAVPQLPHPSSPRSTFVYLGMHAPSTTNPDAGEYHLTVPRESQLLTPA